MNSTASRIHFNDDGICNYCNDFEKKLNDSSLIYDHFISKFDKDFVYYRIIYNGTPNNFLKSMSDVGYNFNTQNKFWILK